MAIVIIVANQKGGVGKTNTAINVAVCLSLKGKRTLLTDIDPQGNASRVLSGGRFAFERSSAEIFSEKKLDVSELIEPACDGSPDKEIDNLYLLPANDALSNAIKIAATRVRRESILANAFKQIDDELDYIVVDCPPNKDLGFQNAVTAADIILVPIDGGGDFSLDGIGSMLQSIEELRGEGDDAPVMRVFRSIYDVRKSKVNNKITKELTEGEMPTLTTKISDSTQVSQGILENRAVVKFAKGSVVAGQFQRLTSEAVALLE
ncbi:ParA family protein [Pseudoalteromonas sp. C2R02]|uniref:ParA family protein n=1 Tax=Pseudoalteromonas sp. C2R02 TaxID=2841565 RepID=UPI001C0A3B2E|nr:ParA family protein [Pseudoalteromonas sp. C2R02]MBU2968739.1 ParA family protein [Pseudoalteromonas sp. C2R02]